jgi:hypothetical protein
VRRVVGGYDESKCVRSVKMVEKKSVVGSSVTIRVDWIECVKMIRMRVG